MAPSAIASPSSAPSPTVVLSSSEAVSPSSAAVPPPPLSYAERARKAQNIRSPSSHDPRPSSDPPSPAAHPKSPTVNVWSQRMAAARATAPTMQSPPVSAPSSGPSAVSPTPESPHHDPFVVRTSISSAQQPPLAIDDNTWPEVGKPCQDEITPNHHPVAPGPSPRKTLSSPGTQTNLLPGEKTKSKWVPIPRQELQAAADALDNRRRKSSRHHSLSGSRKPPSKTLAQTSASGSVSHSRIASASQSRSESLQSSPLLPRGRRLPDDKEVPQISNPRSGSSRPHSPPLQFNTTSTSSPHQQQHPSSIFSSHPSTSRPHSPPLVVQPHLAPSPQPIPVYTHPDPNPFVVRYGPSAPYSASSPPGTYPPGFPYSLPLQQPVWYPNFGAIQHWNPNQPGSGHHSPRYPNNPNIYQLHQIPRQHHDHINSRATTMTEHSNHDPTSTQHQNTGQTGTRLPEVSLPVTVSASTPVHVNEYGCTQHIPTFGSIGTDRSPSAVSNPKPMDEDDPKPFPQFTIGVAPGEVLSNRSRSRAPSQTSSNSGKRSRTRTGDEKLGLTEVAENGEEMENQKKVIDLTGGKAASELRWEFGTVVTGQGEASHQVDTVALSSVTMSPSHVMNAGETIDANVGEMGHSPSQSSPSELQKRLEQLVIKGRKEDGHDPFEVKDYGYGFGSRGSSGDSPQTQPQMEQQKYNEGEYTSPVWERERVEYAPRHGKREASSRRSGYHNPNHHSNPYHGQGVGHEGRAYPPRRGRGNNHGNGYGRGGYTHRRNGSSNISGYQHQQHLHMRSAASFSLTTPPDPVVAAGGFYAGPPMMGVNGIGMNGMYYDGTGYTPIPMPQAAPVPAPVTQLSFSLDTTRWYLLGQLEYYLSAQNMAQDYFLRQRLDSKGWVPISLIASFNRVRQLTEDEALVHEVLALSSVVEVRGVWVRMKDWRAFVLPGARLSSVEHEDDLNTSNTNHPSIYDQDEATYTGKDGHQLEKRREEQDNAIAGSDGDVYEDDEDEDDVVFVLTRDEDAKIPWPAQKRN
ncbi:hypothetical protein C0989_010693 [Termitomyces sp. Mn162]|nr:hypothetical protein C0989_010693 [Termitomyces sp. Mn162]